MMAQDTPTGIAGPGRDLAMGRWLVVDDWSSLA